MDSETVWRALASPHRRRILDLLRGGGLTTGELSREFRELSRFGVMQHLQVLVEAGLVLVRREGRQRFNFANPIPLREVYERWVEPHSSSAAATALHLKRYAENNQEVTESMDPNSYRQVRIELEMRIKAPRERVFAALTSEYDAWWPHRFKPDSTVYFESEIGGQIGERFRDGGGALYGTVVYLDAPHKIVTSGMGALSRGNVGFSTDTLESDGDETIYRRELMLWGTVPEQVEQMFREGTRALLEKALNDYLVHGTRYVAPGEDE